MPKKSNVAMEEVRKWLDRVAFADQARKDADERFGYTLSLRQYAGDFHTTMPSFLANTPVVPINEIFGYVKAFLPSVYSRNPRVAFNPRGAASVASAKLLEIGVNGYWNELRLKRQVRRAIFDAIFAEGWFKTGYTGDFYSEPGDGEQPLESNEFVRKDEIFSHRVSWKLMVRDPDAVDGIHDARFVAQKIIKPLRAVQESSLFTCKDIRATHVNDAQMDMDKTRRMLLGEKEEFIEYWEIWDMDTAKVYWVSQGCDGYMRDPLKWPYRFDGYPFDLLRFTQMEDEAYAPNLITPWLPQLWEKIKIRSLQMDHIKRFNRQLAAEEGSLTDKEKQKFSMGQTGAIITFKAGKQPPMPIQYPQIQTDIYGVENRVDLDKDNISGQPNAVRSAPQKTQSRTLGEINTMVAAFQSRQLDPQADVEDFCGEVAFKIAAVMQDYLPGDKFVRIMQHDIQTIRMAFGEDRFDGNGFNLTKDDIAGAEFDTEVAVGSTLPLDKQNRINAMIDILKLGPSIGVQPGDEVSLTIGKNMLSDFEMKEIELAFDRKIQAIQIQKTMAKAAQRMQLEATEDRINQARGFIRAMDQGDMAGGGEAGVANGQV